MSNKHNESQAPVAPVAVEQSADDKKSAALISATMEAVAEKLMPAMMAAMIQAQNAPKAGEAAAIKAAQDKVARRAICRVCKQALVGCEGKHTNIVVYPMRYPEFGKWFQGSIINGIRYLSDHRNNQIAVPAGCVGQIIKQVADFEENERVTRMGRSAEHHSGDINSEGGSSVRSPNQAWR